MEWLALFFVVAIVLTAATGAIYATPPGPKTCERCGAGIVRVDDRWGKSYEACPACDDRPRF